MNSNEKMIALVPSNFLSTSVKNKSTFLSTVNKITPIAPCLVAVDPGFPNGRWLPQRWGRKPFLLANFSENWENLVKR